MPPKIHVIAIHDTLMLFEMIRQQQACMAKAQDATIVQQCKRMIRLYQGGVELHMWEQRN